MKENFARPSCQNLEDYALWLDREAQTEFNIKYPAYEWIQKTGENLAQMTAGKEKKELIRVVKEVKLKWLEINELLDQRKAKVNHLLQV